MVAHPDLIPNGDSANITRTAIASTQPDWVVLPAAFDVVIGGSQFLINIYGDGGITEAQGQSVTAGVTQTIYGAHAVIIPGASVTDEIKMRIRTGSMTGTVIGTSDAIDPTVDYFVFPAGVAIESGTVYYLELYRTGSRGTGGDGWSTSRTTANDYAGGTLWTKDNGSWSANSSFDLQNLEFPLAHPVNGTSNTAGQFGVTLSDTEIGFLTMDSGSVTIRHSRTGTGGDDTKVLFAQVFRADGSTALSNEMQIFSSTAAYAARTDEVALTGLVAGDKTIWDGAQIRVRWTNSQSMAADGQAISIQQARLTSLQYTSSIVPGVPTMFQRPQHLAWRL